MAEFFDPSSSNSGGGVPVSVRVSDDHWVQATLTIETTFILQHQGALCMRLKLQQQDEPNSNNAHHRSPRILASFPVNQLIRVACVSSAPASAHHTASSSSSSSAPSTTLQLVLSLSHSRACEKSSCSISGPLAAAAAGRSSGGFAVLTLAASASSADYNDDDDGGATTTVEETATIALFSNVLKLCRSSGGRQQAVSDGVSSECPFAPSPSFAAASRPKSASAGSSPVSPSPSSALPSSRRSPPRPPTREGVYTANEDDDDDAFPVEPRVYSQRASRANLRRPTTAAPSIYRNNSESPSISTRRRQPQQQQQTLSRSSSSNNELLRELEVLGAELDGMLGELPTSTSTRRPQSRRAATASGAPAWRTLPAAEAAATTEPDDDRGPRVRWRLRDENEDVDEVVSDDQEDQNDTSSEEEEEVEQQQQDNLFPQLSDDGDGDDDDDDVFDGVRGSALRRRQAQQTTSGMKVRHGSRTDLNTTDEDYEDDDEDDDVHTFSSGYAHALGESLRLQRASEYRDRTSSEPQRPGTASSGFGTEDGTNTTVATEAFSSTLFRQHHHRRQNFHPQHRRVNSSSSALHNVAASSARGAGARPTSAPTLLPRHSDPETREGESAAASAAVSPSTALPPFAPGGGGGGGWRPSSASAASSTRQLRGGHQQHPHHHEQQQQQHNNSASSSSSARRRAAAAEEWLADNWAAILSDIPILPTDEFAPADDEFGGGRVSFDTTDDDSADDADEDVW